MISGYLQALLSRVRLLSLNRFSHTPVQHLPLPDVTVARMLALHAAEELHPSSAVTLLDVLQRPAARICLSGETGIGKTVVLHRLAFGCAASLLNEGEWIEEIGKLTSDVTPLPILVDAAEPVSGTRSIVSVIQAHLAQLHMGDPWDTMEQVLLRGDALLLIDNFDSENPAAVDMLRAWVRHFPQNRYVVACRSAAAPPTTLPEFTAYRPTLFERETVLTLVAHWLTAFRALGARSTELPLEEQIADLQGQIQRNEGFYEFVRHPLALAVCLIEHLTGQSLPHARSSIYAQFTDVVLAALPLQPAELVRQHMLEPLALAAELAGSRPAYLSDHELRTLTRADELPFDTAQMVAELCRTGLLQHNSNGYRMPIRGVRTWLAGCALAQAPDPAIYLNSIRADPRRHEMFCLAIQERTRQDLPIRDLLKRLLDEAQTAENVTPSTARRAAPRNSTGRGGLQVVAPRNGADILLAAEALCNLEYPDQHVPSVLSDLRHRLLALIEQEVCPLPERVRAGLLLGLLGDPRFDTLLPPLVEIGGGMAIIGAHTPGYDEEGPPFRIDLPGFQIGRYPVTNREYGRFLADTPRYPKPRYWYDPRFNNPSLPVVGVTWHDAQAFCTWLTGRLAAADLLSFGSVVRLPTEMEWEKAASWGPRVRRKRRYPWGDEWRLDLVNVAESRQNWLTTPVGCYPDGVSAYGVHDMLGNVWEWTQSQYTSYPGAARPFLQQHHYVLRGHSCVSLANQARITYRSSHLPPHYWRYHLGFRIVIGPPLRG